MIGSSVSAVTAYTAHREWASRPPDERYASVHALYDAARARRLRTDERTIDTVDVRTEAVASDANREELRVVGGWQTTGGTDPRIEVIADMEFVEEGVRSRQGQT